MARSGHPYLTPYKVKRLQALGWEDLEVDRARRPGIPDTALPISPALIDNGTAVELENHL